MSKSFVPGESERLPLIAPCNLAIREGASRLFWSVMVPAFNPQADYLEETLRSVLQQDPGPERMQVEVVDDCRRPLR